MLETLNEYAHGFVAIPMLDSCRRGGILQALADGGPLPQANSGYLKAALRLLDSLGWLEVNGTLSASGTLAFQVPDVRTLYNQPIGPESSWLRLAEKRWPEIDPELHTFMDGTLLTRLLPTLENGAVPEWLEPYCRALGWYEDSSLHDWAEYLLERGMILGTTASYRPMLGAMDDLLFGDPGEVFGRDEAGRERHLDRSLNVSASGFQHSRYFRDVRESLSAIFSGPVEQQPNAVCDMGCGDGTFLKEVYESVRATGRDLERYPVTLVAADFNEQALEVARRNLDGLPHLTVTADIGRPQDLLSKLAEAGVDPEKTLHIRSFLDHNRPYIAPLGAPVEGADGVYIDETGAAREPGEVAVNLVEHLRRWSEVVGEQGLLLLEVHSLPARTVRQFREQTENLHFDAYHALSGQLLTDAPSFLLAAAQAGLFPTRAYGKKYPNQLPLTRITLSWFKPKPYRVVRLNLTHLPRLREVEAAAVEPHLHTEEQELRRRLLEWPNYQLGLEVDGELVGAVFSQPVQSLDDVTYASQGSLADADGARVQLLGLWTDPDHAGLGDGLLDFALQWLAVHPGVEEVVGITRCRDFSGGSLAEHAPHDPVVRFHLNHGALLGQVLEGYRPADTANHGCGIRITYLPEFLFGKSTTAVERAADVAGIIKEILTDPASFEADRPLRELGLDSLNLMELKTRLEQAFQVPLESSFFFRYRTAQEIESYLQDPVTIKVPAIRAVKAPDIQEKDAVAVVGIGCRFPGASNSEQLWDLLSEGRTTTNQGARRIEGSPPCSLLDAVDEFDERFFRIAPREAALMDPQHRILLETSWEALEDAGIDPHLLKKEAVGVYLGLFSHDYEAYHKQCGMNSHSALALASSAAPGRLSYFYDWSGPAMAVHTACSSSLVAVHLARRAILDGECEMALAGGVNLILTSELSGVFQQAGMLSEDGLCKAFDASADGYGRGEGCGIVVLKRLSAARRDGDHVMAVIRSSVTNQDGASNGLTAPSQQAQESLHLSCLREAGIEPAQLSYLEAHGTGTPLGDPIEMEAIQNVLGQNRKEPLWVGSIKANLGHTEAAAGVAGLIKAVLCLRHGEIPGQPHFHDPSPHIVWDRAPVEVCASNRPLPDGLVGVSSFGFSGTNCQVLLERPQRDERELEEGPHLFALSCATPSGLDRLRESYLEALPGREPAAFAATSTAGRAHHRYRMAVMAKSAEDACSALGQASPSDAPRVSPKVTFLFTGQGSQYGGMGAELYAQEKVFRDCLDRLAAAAVDILPVPLLEVMFQGAGPLDLTTFTQPAIYCFEVAMARLWESWGVRPSSVMGHSVGEFAAAHLAGVFSEEEGLRLVAARGRLMGALPEGGAMAAVIAGPEIVEPMLEEGVEIACYNGPRHVVVSGLESAVQRLSEQLIGDGVMVRPLTVSHAFHSHLMEPMLDDFYQVLKETTFHPPSIPLLSNLTGTPVQELNASYWRDHARAAVKFEQGLSRAVQDGGRVFLEVGPAPHLCGMARRIQSDPEIAWIPAHGTDRPRAALLDAARQLYLKGVKLDFRFVQPGPRCAIPTYPWARSSHWLRKESRLVGETVEVAAGPYRYVNGHYSPDDNPGGVRAETWLESALEITGAAELSRIAFLEPLDSDLPRDVQWAIRDGSLEAFSRVSQGEWTRHFLCDYQGTRNEGTELASLDLRLTGAKFIGRLDPLGEHPVEGLVLEQRAHVLPNWCYRLEKRPQSRPEGTRLQPSEYQPTRSNQEQKLVDALEKSAELFLGEALKRLPEGLDDRRLRYLKSRVGASSAVRGEGSPGGSEWELLQRCGPWLAEVLSGKKKAIELLAPGGDVGALARFYKTTDTFTHLNRELARLVASMSSGTDRLRVLEVGAGTGATTDAVFRALGPDRLDYTFTDISSAFFATSPQGAKTALFDVEKHPGQQGFQGGSYDLVLAANVLHATVDLDESLAHLKWLLAPGGALVVLEGEQERLWVDLTFGLTDGWWRCADREYPLLSGEEWVGRLGRLGYVRPHFHRPEGQQVFPQALVVAFKPTSRWSVVKNDVDGIPSTDELILAPPRDDYALALAAVQKRSERLWFVVTPNCPGMAGLARTLALEMPERFGGILHLADSRSCEPLVSDWLNSEPGREWRYEGGEWSLLTLHQQKVEEVEWKPASDGTYLITGGMSGIGLRLAERLARIGVGKLALLSRGSHPESLPTIERIRGLGTQVQVFQCDVSCRADLERVFTELDRVEGVFHLAGVLSDAPLGALTAEDFRKVWAAKVEGAENLVALTRGRSLTNFTVFSSLSAVLGSPGQANHAFSNAALDGICEELSKRGIQALSLNWGAWSEIGSAASPETVDFMNQRGWLGMEPGEAFRVLESLLARQVTGQIVVSAMDWRRWTERFGDSALWADFASPPDDFSKQSGDSLEDRVCREVATVLGLSNPSLLPRDTGFFELGLDSLTSLELRGRLIVLAGQNLSTTVCFDYPTVQEMAAYLSSLEGDASPRNQDLSLLEGVEVPPLIADLSYHEVILALGRELSAN